MIVKIREFLNHFNFVIKSFNSLNNKFLLIIVPKIYLIDNRIQKLFEFFEIVNFNESNLYENTINIQYTKLI